MHVIVFPFHLWIVCNSFCCVWSSCLTARMCLSICPSNCVASSVYPCKKCTRIHKHRSEISLCIYNKCKYKLNSLYLCCLPLSICHGICLITLYQADYNLNCNFTKHISQDIVLQGFVFQTAHRTAIIHPKYSVHDSNYTHVSCSGNANQANLKN